MVDPRPLPRRSPKLLLLFALIPVAALGQQPVLTIAELSFRQYDGGPAWAAGYQPLSGDTVCLDFRIAGLATKEGDFDDLFGYEFTLTPVDEQSRPWASANASKVEGTVSPEDKKSGWRPKVSACFPTPPLLSVRQFRIQVAIRDRIASAEAKATAAFTLRGVPVPRAESISAHGFRFLREEEDREPLRVVAYRAGDTVWGRFEMAGFRVSTTGSVDVAYGLAVFNADGKRLFELPVAAEERRTFPYPPDYLPGVVSLQLQPGTPAGEYTIELILTDRAAGAEARTRRVFRIE